MGAQRLRAGAATAAARAALPACPPTPAPAAPAAPLTRSAAPRASRALPAQQAAPVHAFCARSSSVAQTQERDFMKNGRHCARPGARQARGAGTSASQAGASKVTAGPAPAAAASPAGVLRPGTATARGPSCGCWAWGARRARAPACASSPGHAAALCRQQRGPQGAAASCAGSGGGRLCCLQSAGPLRPHAHRLATLGWQPPGSPWRPGLWVSMQQAPAGGRQSGGSHLTCGPVCIRQL